MYTIVYFNEKQQKKFGQRPVWGRRFMSCYETKSSCAKKKRLYLKSFFSSTTNYA